jgi:hypothetical protein
LLAASFDEWRPCIEGTVDDLRLEVKKISLGWERVSVEKPGDKSSVFTPSPSTAQRPAAEISSPVMWPALTTRTGRVDLGLFQP